MPNFLISMCIAGDDKDVFVCVCVCVCVCVNVQNCFLSLTTQYLHLFILNSDPSIHPWDGLLLKVFSKQPAPILDTKESLRYSVH